MSRESDTSQEFPLITSCNLDLLSASRHVCPARQRLVQFEGEAIYVLVADSVEYIIS